MSHPEPTAQSSDESHAAHGHAGAHSPEEIRKHVRFYIGIFGALLVLTFITVGVAQFHIGPEDTNVPNIIIGLLIATVKASLVAAFFMHLSSEKKMVYRVLAFTVAFALALMFLMLLAFFDPITVPAAAQP